MSVLPIVQTIVSNKLLALFFTLLFITGVGYFSVYFLGDNNPVEEVSEALVGEVVGEKIDFYPHVAEKNVPH